MPAALDLLNTIEELCDRLATAGNIIVEARATAARPVRQDHRQGMDAELNARLTDALLQLPGGRSIRIGDPAINYTTTGGKRLLCVGADGQAVHLAFDEASGTAGATYLTGVAAPGADLRTVTGQAAQVTFTAGRAGHYVTSIHLTVGGWVNNAVVDATQLAQALGGQWLPMEEDIQQVDPHARGLLVTACGSLPCTLQPAGALSGLLGFMAPPVQRDAMGDSVNVITVAQFASAMVERDEKAAEIAVALGTRVGGREMSDVVEHIPQLHHELEAVVSAWAAGLGPAVWAQTQMEAAQNISALPEFILNGMTTPVRAGKGLRQALANRQLSGGMLNPVLMVDSGVRHAPPQANPFSPPHFGGALPPNPFAFQPPPGAAPYPVPMGIPQPQPPFGLPTTTDPNDRGALFHASTFSFAFIPAANAHQAPGASVVAALGAVAGIADGMAALLPGRALLTGFPAGTDDDRDMEAMADFQRLVEKPQLTAGWLPPFQRPASTSEAVSRLRSFGALIGTARTTAEGDRGRVAVHKMPHLSDTATYTQRLNAVPGMAAKYLVSTEVFVAEGHAVRDAGAIADTARQIRMYGGRAAAYLFSSGDSDEPLPEQQSGGKNCPATAPASFNSNRLGLPNWVRDTATSYNGLDMIYATATADPSATGGAHSGAAATATAAATKAAAALGESIGTAAAVFPLGQIDVMKWHTILGGDPSKEDATRHALLNSTGSAGRPGAPMGDPRFKADFTRTARRVQYMMHRVFVDTGMAKLGSSTGVNLVAADDAPGIDRSLICSCQHLSEANQVRVLQRFCDKLRGLITTRRRGCIEDAFDLTLVHEDARAFVLGDSQSAGLQVNQLIDEGIQRRFASTAASPPSPGQSSAKQPAPAAPDVATGDTTPKKSKK